MSEESAWAKVDDLEARVAAVRDLADRIEAAIPDSGEMVYRSTVVEAIRAALRDDESL